MSISTFPKHATLKSEQNAECHWSFKRFKRTIWTVEVMPWNNGEGPCFQPPYWKHPLCLKHGPLCETVQTERQCSMPPNVVFIMLMLLSSMRPFNAKGKFLFPVKFHSQRATSSSGTHLPNLVVKGGGLIFSSKRGKRKVFCCSFNYSEPNASETQSEIFNGRSRSKSEIQKWESGKFLPNEMEKK